MKLEAVSVHSLLFAEEGAPSPALKVAFLLFGAVAMALPSGFALGTLAYIVLSRGRPEREDEKDLPLWGKALYRRSVRNTTLVIFFGLLALALISSSLRR